MRGENITVQPAPFGKPHFVLIAAELLSKKVTKKCKKMKKVLASRQSI